MSTVRITTNADMKAVMQYVEAEPEYNLFIIGDLERFGLESPDCQVFVRDSDKTSGFDWLALLYQGNFVFYSQSPDFDAGEVAEFFAGQTYGGISGKHSLLLRLEPLIPGRSLTFTHLARLDTLTPLNTQEPDGVMYYQLTPDEAEALIDLYCQVPEFRVSYPNPTQSTADKWRAMELGGDRACGFFRNGQLISAAGSTAEHSTAAMIIGVATLPDCRGLGLASLAVSRLCQELLDSGKSFLCLFYSNPAAGRIYQRIGFREVGAYGMLNLK